MASAILTILLTSIELENPEEDWGVLTVKVTPKTEINVGMPSVILTIPENTPGKFVLITEASEDLIHWKPISSMLIDSSSPSRFFRTRIVKSP